MWDSPWFLGVWEFGLWDWTGENWDGVWDAFLPEGGGCLLLVIEFSGGGGERGGADGGFLGDCFLGFCGAGIKAGDEG